MENVRKLETVVASWYKNVPHLPVAGQKLLAQNAWWIVLVWLVLSALGVASVLFGTLILGAAVTGLTGAVGAAVSGFAFVIVLITMLFSVAMLIIGAMAISPLKAMQKKGWMLLFIVSLVNVLAAVITFLFGFNLLALIWDLLLVAVAGYFLFEIHGYFDGASSRKKVAATKKKSE